MPNDRFSKIESVVKDVLNTLPPGLSATQAEIKKTLHAGVDSALQKMNLVSREEYDVQTQLLERLRQRVTELETRLAEYERNKDRSSSS